MKVMTQIEAQEMVREMLEYERGGDPGIQGEEEVLGESEELAEAQLNKRPVDPGKPWTQEHLRDVLVDAQMRLAGAANFGYALVKAGEWEDADRRGFENEMHSVISRLQNVYSNLEEEEAGEGEELAEARGGRSFADHLQGASAAFLKQAEKGVKKAAGTKAETLKVVTSMGVAVLHYVGQDAWGERLALNISLVPKYADIEVHMDGKGDSGQISRNVPYKSEALMPDTIVGLFMDAFGRRAS